ncbi:MAG: MBL fold metallo-hydrolase [Chloroflexi bacterium]|nr:MBL fold metallo-hydrolase [Chloroflexota bacterium]
MLLEKLEVGGFASNCYIVASEKTKEGMLVDAGDDADRIMKRLEAHGVKLQLIVLTHGHLDHVGAVRKIKEATGAKLAAHADERLAGASERQMVSSQFGIKLDAPPPPDMLLRGGDTIKVGDLSFQVLHTPGHSPGGICLVGHGVVFTGDTLFNYGIGRYDFPGGNLHMLMDSIHTRLLTLPDNTIAYPGHGPETTIGDERQGNPFLKPGVQEEGLM